MKIQKSAPLFLYRRPSDQIRVMMGDPLPVTTKRVQLKGKEWVEVEGTLSTGIKAEYILALCEDFGNQTGLKIKSNRVYRIHLSLEDAGPLSKELK